MRNLKLAFRTLFKSPFVAIVAILSLALGIGANAAIYSLFHELLLQPLPVTDPSRLVNFKAPGPQFGSNSCNDAGDCDEVFSYPMLRDLQKANTAFSGIAGHFLFGVNLGMTGQTPVNGRGVYVTGNYFSVLGLRPAVGRLLTAADDETIGGNYVVVLSYPFWETNLGADPSVVGKRITVNGQQLTILGVAPKDFTGTTLGTRPYLFAPISMRGVLSQGWTGFERRDSYWVYLFGRLKPGATIDQATASVNTVYHTLINDVEAPQRKGMSAKTMQEFRAKKVILSEGRRGQSNTIKQSRTPVILLFSITGIVLLIACANIANLLLARAANRSMEMAVRLSLGATRRQLIAQVLTESLLLAVLGGIAGLAVAHWTLVGVTSMLPVQAQGWDGLHVERACAAVHRLHLAGDGLLVRRRAGAPEHASGPGDRASQQLGQARRKPDRGAFPSQPGDGADRALYGAAHRGGAVHQESAQHQPRRSRREHRQHGDVRDLAGAERLRLDARAAALLAASKKFSARCRGYPP
jgi:predicted permease